MDDHDWPASGAFDAARRIRRIANRLDALAEAFEVPGNSKVANDLYDIARHLDCEAGNVTSAIGDQTAHDLREARRGVAATLSAVLERT